MGFLMIFTLLVGSFSILYTVYLVIFGGGAGFTGFWVILSIISFICHTIFKHYDTVKEVVPKIIRYPIYTLGILLLVVFIVVEALIVYHSFDKQTYPHTDYVIVLGAGIRGTELSLTLTHRLDVAYDYLLDHPESKAILTGGQGPGEDITEAEAMRAYLKGKGIDDKRLIMEDRATSTQENIDYSLALMDSAIENPKITIVTSNFHMFRAKMIAKKHGLIVEGISCGTFIPLIPNYYIREFFAVVKDIVFFSMVNYK